MNVNHFLITLSTAGLLLLTLAIQTGARADDIDIYLNPVLNTTDQPVAMFTLDYRSNLGSTVDCSGTKCTFLTSASYLDAGGVSRPYLTLTGTSTTFFNLLRGALKYVLQQVGPSGVKIGLAMSHDQGTGASCAGPPSGSTKCTNGGYIIKGAGALDTQTLRDAFYAKLDAMPTPGGTVNHSYQGKELFFELFRYFSGQGWYNMKNGWTDRGTNNTYNVDQNLDYGASSTTAPLTWDAGIVSGANYISPVVAGCAKLYTINILFQVSNQEDDSDTAIKAASTAGGMGGINLAGANNKFSTVIRWMYDNDNNTTIANKQNVISYFIVDSTKVNTTTKGYAGAGQGVASLEPYTLSNDPKILVDTFTAIFKNILSTSTTFVAPTVAVNVYNRAQVQDDVYIAMFQAPDPYHPRWPGNLKKYKIASRQIQDVNGLSAVDPAKGRIKDSALSYWTYHDDPNADLPYPAADEVEFVATKDGRGVDRGGAGSKIPGAKLKCASATDPLCYPGDYSPGLTNPSGTITDITARKVFYDKPDGALGALNADVATATALQSNFGGTSVGTCLSTDTDGTSACNLLTYARGGVYVAVGGSTVLRGQQWMLGDLLHSRPIAVNYGTRGGYSTTYPNVRLIAGSNDGLMHMFRNTSADQTSLALVRTPNEFDGVETWAFMPRQVMPTVKTLQADANPTTPPHPYTVDGSPAVFIRDNNGNGNIETPDADGKNDAVWLFFGLRRGGNIYYAMDITDPDSPTLKWTITGGAGDFAELGQTWSTPQIGYMLFDGSTDPKPVLIFGGGYATNKDTHVGHNDASGVAITSTQIGTDDGIGNALFIVNADTGALVWKAVKGTYAATSSKVFHHPDLVDSIPSEISAIDTGGNGLIDRLYFGDTGGRVWRADLACKNQDGTGCTSGCKKTDGTTDCTNGWKVTPILSVGRHYTNDLTNDRRFFYPPDLALSMDIVCTNADDTLFVTLNDGTLEDGTPCNGVVGGTSFVGTVKRLGFDAVVIGTGDRETPKDLSVKNWFYMYKDRNTATGSIPDDFATVLHNDSQLGDVSNDCLQTGTCAVGAAPDLTKGWKMRLHCQQSTIDNTCGEKNLSSALTVSGTIFFTTYIPAGGVPTACSLPEGNGLLYEVSLQQGFAVKDFYAGNGTVLDDPDRATTLASGGIPAEVVSLGGDILRPDLGIDDAGVKAGLKTFWYEKYLR